MSTNYCYNSEGFYSGYYEGVEGQPGSTKLPPIHTDGMTPQFVNGAWVDQGAPAIPPKIGPIAFKMLFTPDESEEADDLKLTDRKLSSFWKLIDDPRTTEVDLSLKTVQNAIEYTLMAVKASGVAVDVPTRKAQILTGVVQ